MRKIGILILVLFATLLFSQSFGYFESRVYCKIEDNNITVFLKNDGGLSKCESYVDAVYQLALKKYSEISAIRSYIDQGDDVYYWKDILEEKKAEFLKLINYRSQIKQVVNKFETAFFDKYYLTLQSYMKVYYSELEAQYYLLLNQDYRQRVSNYNIKISQLSQQMQNVSRVLNATKLDDIMEVMSSYLYLKQQLIGK